MTDQLPKVNDRKVRNNLVEMWTEFEWIFEKWSNPVNHPLTDEMCGKIQEKFHACPDDWHYEDMRAAADWQLEADAHWWKLILKEVGFLPPDALDEVIEKFKQAMRPQEES